MTYDEVTVKVRVTEHPLYVDDPRRVQTLFEDSTSANDLASVSVDELLSVARRFPYGEMGIGTWFRIDARASYHSTGGDGATLELVLEFMGELQGVAYDTLAGLFVAFLLNELRGPKDDAE